MREYLQSGWVRVGLGLFILGCGPLIVIVVAAAIGLWPDPNPNPIGPGLLAFLTFWPSVIVWRLVSRESDCAATRARPNKRFKLAASRPQVKRHPLGSNSPPMGVRAMA